MSRKFPVVIGVRGTKADDKRLDDVTAQIPFAHKGDIARAALRIGLKQIEANPALAIDEIGVGE